LPIIAGAVGGGLAALALLGLASFFLVKKRRANGSQDTAVGPAGGPDGGETWVDMMKLDMPPVEVESAGDGHVAHADGAQRWTSASWRTGARLELESVSLEQHLSNINYWMSLVKVSNGEMSADPLCQGHWQLARGPASTDAFPHGGWEGRFIDSRGSADLARQILACTTNGLCDRPSFYFMVLNLWTSRSTTRRAHGVTVAKRPHCSLW
jgi:hypothetical protein